MTALSPPPSALPADLCLWPNYPLWGSFALGHPNITSLGSPSPLLTWVLPLQTLAHCHFHPWGGMDDKGLSILHEGGLGDQFEEGGFNLRRKLSPLNRATAPQPKPRAGVLVTRVCVEAGASVGVAAEGAPLRVTREWGPLGGQQGRGRSGRCH